MRLIGGEVDWWRGTYVHVLFPKTELTDQLRSLNLKAIGYETVHLNFFNVELF
jgi:hypothetical protein